MIIQTCSCGTRNYSSVITGVCFGCNASLQGVLASYPPELTDEEKTEMEAEIEAWHIRFTKCVLAR